MAMTVNPNAGTKAPDTFHEEGLHAFRFDVNDDAHEEVTFKIRFGEAGHAEGEGPEGRHVQTLEVRRATGREAAEGTEGEVIASGATGRIVAGDAGVRIFAGLAPDLFAANLTGNVAFRAALAAGKFAPDSFHDGTNYFHNRNVTERVEADRCGAPDGDRGAGRSLPHLVLHDARLTAEGGPEQVRVHPLSLVGEHVIEPSLDVGDPRPDRR
jgi:hypothetical protein